MSETEEIRNGECILTPAEVTILKFIALGDASGLIFLCTNLRLVQMSDKNCSPP